MLEIHNIYKVIAYNTRIYIKDIFKSIIRHNKGMQKARKKPTNAERRTNVGRLLKAWDKTGKPVDVLVGALTVLSTSGERLRFKKRYSQTIPGSDKDAMNGIIFTHGKGYSSRGTVQIGTARKLLAYITQELIPTQGMNDQRIKETLMKIAEANLNGKSIKLDNVPMPPEVVVSISKEKQQMIMF